MPAGLGGEAVGTAARRINRDTGTTKRTGSVAANLGGAPRPAAAPVASSSLVSQPVSQALASQPVSQPTASSDLLKNVSSLFQQQAPGVAAPAAPAAPVVSTAQNNPDVAYAIGEMKNRYAGDMGAGRAIDTSTSKIRDATTGLMREAAAGRTSRGVSGTGVDDFDTRRLMGGAQRAIAGASADITMGRESAKDAMLGGIAGTGAQQAAILAQEQDRNLRQWEAAQNQMRAAEDARLAREMSVINLLSGFSFN